MYFQFPYIPKKEETYPSSVEFNIKVTQNKPLGVCSLFKINIHCTDIDTFNCNIDNTNNNLQIFLTMTHIVYYIDEKGEKHYYLKVGMEGLGLTPVNLTYLDISTDNYIPEDFLLNNMILTTLPKPELPTIEITTIGGALLSSEGDCFTPFPWCPFFLIFSILYLWKEYFL
jgi:hypothetical protein